MRDLSLAEFRSWWALLLCRPFSGVGGEWEEGSLDWDAWKGKEDGWLQEDLCAPSPLRAVEESAASRL